jgi:hypothetical protein
MELSYKLASAYPVLVVSGAGVTGSGSGCVVKSGPGGVGVASPVGVVSAAVPVAAGLPAV